MKLPDFLLKTALVAVFWIAAVLPLASCGAFYHGAYGNPARGGADIRRAGNGGALNSRSSRKYVKGELIVKFREGTSREDVEKAVTAHGGKIKKFLGKDRYLIKFKGEITVKNAVKKFLELEEVEKAQPNFIYRAFGGGTGG